MFNKTKYTVLYETLTERAKTRTLSGYKETHHVIPQSLGGSNDKSNLVELTAREHFICHWLLIKMVCGEARSKMLYALHGMKAENKFQERYHTKITARIYEKYRIEHAANHSKTMKGRVAWNKGRKLEGEELAKQQERTRNRKKMSPETKAKWIADRIATVTGTHRSEETKQHISLALKGKLKGPMSQDHKDKISEGSLGHKKSLEFAERQRERMKLEFAKNNPNQRQDLQKRCENCGKMFGPSNFSRWHGDNCKEKL